MPVCVWVDGRGGEGGRKLQSTKIMDVIVMATG